MTKKQTPPTATGGDDHATPGPVATDAEAGAPTSPSSAEYSVAFSPRQVAVGLAIVAGLVAIAFRHRRSRDRRSADD
jgi:hypothetical protein